MSPQKSHHSLDEVIQKRRILVTCGTGGVGKTTLSAAIAMRAAVLGKKAVVITVDPAKRLATSLGLKDLGDTPMDLTPLLKRAFADHPPEAFKKCVGTLAAIVPDSRTTFETFMKGLAPTTQIMERVLKNPIVDVFAREFSGANEYLALERLYHLDLLKEYDFIVLDTPPSRNTLAFLEAPQLLARLFEEKLVRWFVLPANKIAAAGMRKAMGILEKITGEGFMTHLFDFGGALFEIQENFLKNLKAINALLQSQDVGFLLVTVPTPETVPELNHFVDSVKEHGFHFDGIALNRTLSYLDTESATAADRGKASQGFEVLDALKAREQSAISELKNFSKKSAIGSQIFYTQLPELARDVHSVEDLFHVAMAFDHSLS
ncbi:MAG: ArsA family ATPase [Methylotenera sp.]|nr:ArsA family ATPase [Oligoflexia bacterium]